MNTPTPEAIKSLRHDVQAAHNISEHSAIWYCAQTVYQTPTTWLKWERGEAVLHPALWRLVKTKVETLTHVYKH